jgi:protoporphyrin/coproporphyrin ferrochelatase
VVKDNFQLLIVNFGGPRDLKEIFPFLKELLTDRDVVDSSLPGWLHTLFFTYLAKKRAKKVQHDYRLIGGKSPLFEDTEAIARDVGEHFQSLPLIFHRYLPQTHPGFIEQMYEVKSDTIVVFPLFPQFSYSTTGSIARFFAKRLPPELVKKMKWVRSYPTHSAFIECMQQGIRDFFVRTQLKEEEMILFFSPHGLPRAFVDRGDPYQKECEHSFEEIAKAFPKALCKLAYQSKFGKGEWLRPYTDECCRDVKAWCGSYKHVLFIPLSFTSDHIETLFEIEYQYLPLIREKGLTAHRLNALNRHPDWIEAIVAMIRKSKLVENELLIRC